MSPTLHKRTPYIAKPLSARTRHGALAGAVSADHHRRRPLRRLRRRRAVPSHQLLLYLPSLPLYAPTAESHWLSNLGFSFDASSLHIPATTSSSLPPPLSPSSDEEEAPKPAPAKYELLPSSPSPPASDEERGSRRKDRKRRKRRREKERNDGATASRKPGVRAWAGSETKPAKDYYFDAKGDQDNLAFGSIYRWTKEAEWANELCPDLLNPRAKDEEVIDCFGILFANGTESVRQDATPC